jgi:hypothetical protein
MPGAAKASLRPLTRPLTRCVREPLGIGWCLPRPCRPRSGAEVRQDFRRKALAAYFAGAALGVPVAGAVGAALASAETVALVGAAGAGVDSPPQARDNIETRVAERSAYFIAENTKSSLGTCQHSR